MNRISNIIFMYNLGKKYNIDEREILLSNMDKVSIKILDIEMSILICFLIKEIIEDD